MKEFNSFNFILEKVHPRTWSLNPRQKFLYEHPTLFWVMSHV